MILTAELKTCTDGAPEELALCFDDEGLSLLLRKLGSLQNKADHLHLMTPSWTGSELSEDKQGGKDYTLVNHVRLVKLAPTKH